MVENPATSSPGLSFLLATVDRFGEDGWEAYWQALRANGVLAVDGWEEAYTQQFSGAAGSPGKRPIVVSYATSPAAEVIFASKPLDTSPTAAVEDGCYRQVEYAGVLRGAANEDGARALIDFMLSERFQADVPGSMFVYPVRAGVALPEAFVEHAIVPARPASAPGRATSTRTATAGSPDGPRSSCAEPRRRRDRRGPGRVPRRLLRRGRSWRSSSGASSSTARSTSRPTSSHGVDARDRVVHALAGGRLDGADARRRAPARVGARTILVPRTLARRGARPRALRPADGGRRDRVPRAAPGRRRADRLGDPPRARLLQRRGRRARRRRVLGRARPEAGRRRRDARRVAAPASPPRSPLPSSPPPSPPRRRSCSSSASRRSA